jgi:hypothetical protein
MLRPAIAAATIALAALSLPGDLAARPSRHAASRPIVYTADIPQAHPDIAALWLRQIAPSLRRMSWLSRFEGVTVPIAAIDLAGRPLAWGMSCKPHDCGDNQVRVLFDPAGGRIVGHLRLSGRADRWIGAPTPRERRCLLAEHDQEPGAPPDRC